MDSSILKFRNGTPGYAPQGSRGKSGDDGYSIYYASFGSDIDEQSKMISKIKQKRILSSNESYHPDDVVNYKSNEMIITNDASVFKIDIQDDNISLLLIGGIKKLYYDEDSHEQSGIPFSEYSFISIKISSDTSKQTAVQSYNYSEQNLKSPLWHHRDAKDPNMYGNVLNIESVETFNSNLNNVDGKQCKLIINFNTGLRYEKIITQQNSSEDIFIENRYLYPYGHVGSSIWERTVRLQSEAEEQNINVVSGKTQSQKLQRNIETGNASSLCSGYIEYYYEHQEYRIPIKITI